MVSTNVGFLKTVDGYIFNRTDDNGETGRESVLYHNPKESAIGRGSKTSTFDRFEYVTITDDGFRYCAFILIGFEPSAYAYIKPALFVVSTCNSRRVTFQKTGIKPGKTRRYALTLALSGLIYAQHT
jgi:hypothetical protein